MAPAKEVSNLLTHFDSRDILRIDTIELCAHLIYTFSISVICTIRVFLIISSFQLSMDMDIPSWVMSNLNASSMLRFGIFERTVVLSRHFASCASKRLLTMMSIVQRKLMRSGTYRSWLTSIPMRGHAFNLIILPLLAMFKPPTT
jgi:hypothetical protein